MKIAIPCENGEVMQHFGHATEFTVYTIEDIKPIEKETVTFDDTNHEKVAGGLKSRGVDLVICGNIGEGAHAAIDNAHMLLISGVTGNADEAVDSFLQGNLELMTGDSSASAGGQRLSFRLEPPFMGRLFSWGIGGIGRHNRFKFCWRMPYRFKSDIPHQDKNELRCFCVQDKHYIDTVYVRGG